MSTDALRALEHECERKADRVAHIIANRPRPSSWLVPARDAYRQAAAAAQMAKNVGDEAARAELLSVADAYSAIGASLERLAR